MYARILSGYVFLASIVWSVCSVAEEQGLEDHTHDTWQITFSLDTPNLALPAIQYAVFEKDPVPGFRFHLAMMNYHHQNMLRKALTDDDRKLIRAAFMAVNWDYGFKEIKGFDVHLATPGPGRSSLTSNRTDGKKWIVSKTTWVKGEPVCWCLPVETKTGEKIEVTFTEENAFGMQAVYDDVMRAANQGQ